MAKELRRRLHRIETTIETCFNARDNPLYELKCVPVNGHINAAFPRKLDVLLHRAMQFNKAAGKIRQLLNNAPPSCAQFTEGGEVRAGRNKSRILLIGDAAIGAAQPAYRNGMLCLLSMRLQCQPIRTCPLCLD